MEFDSAWLAPSGVLGDRYEIQRVLGRGGAAIVLLARDRRYEREVAIKVLKPELAGVVATERFLQEVRITASLQHPHILPLLDSGEGRGLPYYVSPYVAGGSLRDRLNHSRQLPIPEALAIAGDIAAALAFAHDRGVLHRDIKPENILLSGEHALVADFGLAQALVRAGGDRLTSSGIAVGTPAYISPEQASGERTLGPPTDIYSLACVIYEMIAGVAPFVGPTAESVIAQRFRGPPHALRHYRPTVPESVDRAVSRAMCSTPADRFQSAREFAGALGVARGTPPNGSTVATVAPLPLPTQLLAKDPEERPTHVNEADGSSGRNEGVASEAIQGRISPSLWRRPSIVGSVSVLMIAVLATVGVRLARGSGARLDNSRVLVTPLTTASSGSPSDQVTRDATQRLGDALSQWTDLHLVDERTAREALEEGSRATLRTDDALKISRRLGAGRLLLGDVGSANDSIVVQATMYDVETGAQMRHARIAYVASSTVLTQLFRQLANRLLRDRDELPWRRAEQTWPASVAGWSAYDAGRRALDSWDLAAAEQHLRDALRVDADLAQAQLWLAQVLWWESRAKPPEEARRAVDEERSLTTKALILGDRLSERDSAMAVGLNALGGGQFPEACKQFNRVLEFSPNDFSGWYGLGDCQSMDQTVLPDKGSPSHYAFRSGFESAANAYRHALQLLTSPYPDFPFIRLGSILYTTSNFTRVGRAPAPSAETFLAYPSLRNDTLAFVPVPATLVSAGHLNVVPPSINAAVSRNQEQLRRLYVMWVTGMPDRALAHERLSGVLESLGLISETDADGFSALNEVRRARGLSKDVANERWLAVAEVRLLLKSNQIPAAKRLADSVIAANTASSPAVADALIGLSALTGRASETSRLMRLAASLTKYAPTTPDGAAIRVPSTLLGEYAEVVARASLGICDRSVREFAAHVDSVLDSYVPDSLERQRDRTAILVRPLTLAAPCLGPRALRNLTKTSERLVAMDADLARGDRAALRSQFDTLRLIRRFNRPGDMSLDYLYLEAWLLAQAGDTAQAVRWLAGSLRAPSMLSPYLLYDAPHAGGLVRAMTLRAELANKMGDSVESQRWASAVTTLWADADTALQPLVTHMRVIARVSQSPSATGRQK
jgi:serine/threonine protein kinase/tetratricopeptide (TPR) repeat protein